jgi:hypothetical protein
VEVTHPSSCEVPSSPWVLLQKQVQKQVQEQVQEQVPLQP